MRKVVHKSFWVWQFDKEEKWLNEMAAKGLCLISVGFCRYEFEECLPGECKIRLELLENDPRSIESEQYISFLEETGAEHVGSYMRWAYFRKKTIDGQFELFSDNSSRIKHLTRIISFLGVICGLNLFLGCYNLFVFFYWQMGIHLIGIINMVLSLFVAICIFRLLKKRRRLKEEQLLFE